MLDNMLTCAMRRKIVEDTVEHYSPDPANLRSYVEFVKHPNGECLYHGPGGKKCAFGRLLLARTIDADENNVSADQFISDNPLKMMKVGESRIKLGALNAEDISFIEDLQSLHDEAYLWNDSGCGLSESGRNRVESILTTWCRS